MWTQWTLPYKVGLLKAMLHDFELGQFWDGFEGTVSRGSAPLQFYLRGAHGEVELRVFPQYGLLAVDYSASIAGFVFRDGDSLDVYLKKVAVPLGISEWTVKQVWHNATLSDDLLRKRKCDCINPASAIADIPGRMTTSKERGVLLACGRDTGPGLDAMSPPMREESSLRVVRCAAALTRMLTGRGYERVSRQESADVMISEKDVAGLEDLELSKVPDAIDTACMARNAIALRALLKSGGRPRQGAYDVCLSNKDSACMAELAKVLGPTAEQLHAIARALPLDEFVKVHAALVRKSQ